MPAGDEIPDLSSGLSANDKQAFELKRLDLSIFRADVPQTRKQAWQDIHKFLTSVRRELFTHEELPENYVQRELFAPQLSYPTRAANIMYLGLDQESKSESRNQFLFIEDVFHLTYEIWQILLEEERSLNTKYQTALKNSQLGEEKTKKNWEERLTHIAELREFLRTDIRSLQSQFEPYNFSDGTERITKKISDLLLERRKDYSRAGEFQSALDVLIGFVEKISLEAGLDVGELPETDEVVDEAEPEVTEEKEEEEVPVGDEGTFNPTKKDEPDTDTGSGPNTPADEFEPAPRPDEKPPGPGSLQETELSNLKVITIETERLSRIFLYQLASQYGLPPELLQNDVTGFRETIREDMRQWIIKKLQAGELDELYNPGKVRERQMLVVGFGAILERDGRFALFQKILVEHFKTQLRTASNPIQQKDFESLLESDEFQSPEKWQALLKNFSLTLLDPTSDPENQKPVNPAPHIESVLKSSIKGLAAEISELGIADLNSADNPLLFSERLNNITTMIDVMVALRFAPIYLDTLGLDHFRETFKINVTEGEYRSLVTVLQTYWDLRERSFSEHNVHLDYILNGLDVDELEDWFERMSSQSRDLFFHEYLERMEYFAEIGRRIGGFHRVVLTMAPRDPKKKGDGKVKDADLEVDSSAEAAEQETAVKKLKLMVMREGLAFAWSELPDDAKRAVYNQIDASQTDEWLKTGYFPEDLTFNDLDLISQYANELGIVSPLIGDTSSASGGTASGGTPIGAAARGAVNKLRNANKRWQNFKTLAAKRRKKIAKQAAKKAAQAATKATAEVALNALGTALGIPGLGTVLVNLWYSLPKELRDILTFFLITGPLAAIAAVGTWILTGPAWLKGLTLGATNMGAGIGGWFKNLFGGGNAATGAAGTGASAVAGSATTGATSAGFGATGASATQLVTAMHPATQAVLITVGALSGATILNQMVRTNAFLANFPLPTEDKSINEKISKYLALEKNVAVPAPCDQATLKCPELGGGDTYDVTYTIKLTLKGNYTVSINSIKDEITAKFSKKKFEELGQPLPNDIVITKVVIPNTEPNPQSDFEELTTDPNDERNILRPGEELILTYVETYDGKFNNSQVRNIFHLEFFYVDGAQSGNDYVETAKSICIGDCSQEEGCWPATGRVYQGPWGKETHNLNGVGVDAYDLSDPHNHSSALKDLGVPMERMSNPAKIYSPFVAQACYPPFSAVYGNYVTLTTGEWTYWLGHMISRAQETGCQQVQPGDIVGVMGTTGASGGVHAHFELRTLDGAVTVGRPNDPLGEQMPPSLTGNKPPVPWVQNAANPSSPWGGSTGKSDYVGSCYDMD